MIDLGERDQCGVGWDVGLLSVFCSHFSRGVDHGSSGCAPISFLRCGFLVPINSFSRLGFFIVAPSICWLVVVVELVERRFDCCEVCSFFEGSCFC